MKKINELTQIDITSGSNGYPDNIRIGYIGFDSFEEAEQFAKETKSRVRCFHKRDGWTLYECKGDQFGPLTVDDYLKDLGDNYYPVDEESVCELLTEEKSKFTILEKLQKASEDQTVICHYGRYYDTVDNELMSYHKDTHTYVIGVEVDNDK
jgi:hypothetical protein